MLPLIIVFVASSALSSSSSSPLLLLLVVVVVAVVHVIMHHAAVCIFKRSLRARASVVTEAHVRSTGAMVWGDSLARVTQKPWHGMPALASGILR